MRLTRLEASDFLSYEALDLDLNGVSQVVVVGENGHGKSALLDAILWCLYGEGRASADQMVRSGALSSWVKVTFEVMGQCVVVTRHRSKETRAGESSLNVEFDGVRVTRHTIAETQEVIDGIIGLPAATLMAGPFMVQGQSDTLMRARPAERKDLIIKLLELDRFVQYHDAAKVALQHEEDSIRVYEVRMEEAEEKIQYREGIDAELSDSRREEVEFKAEVERLREVVATIREETVVAAERAKQIASLDTDRREANDRVDEWTRFLAEAEGQLANQKIQAEEVLHEPAYLDTTELDQLIEVGESGLVEDEHAVTVAIATATERHTLRAELESMESTARTRDERDVCATCPFIERVDLPRMAELTSILAAPAPDVEQARTAARSRRVDVQRWETQRAGIIHDNELKRQAFQQKLGMKDLAVQLQTQTKERIAQLRSSISTENARVSRLTSERMRLGDPPDMDSLTARLAQATNDLTLQQGLLNTVERKVREAEIRVAELEALAKQYEVWESEIVERRERERILSVLAKAWHRDGVPTLILENALPAIEARANEILARMPGDFAVRIVTQRAKKVGGMIETLDVVVETEGQERDYDLLSGGERFRVDLALRVSLAELLTRRSGTKIETLWLDEPLAALDVNGREAVITSLAAIEDEFGLIVVVSHHDEFNDRFPARIDVVKHSGVSTAEVAA